MKKFRKLLYCALLLLVIGIIGFSGWNLWQEHEDRRISDEQMDIKPPVPEIPAFPDETDGTEEAPALPLMDFTSANKLNSDINAWLSIPGLGIDYPIVQGTDNSFYLSRTAEKRYNKLGALFMDYRVSRDFSDFNNVVYGHNMESGAMFGQLPKMKEQATFDTVTEGFLYTPAKTYKLKIFAVAVAGSVSDYYQYAFAASEDRQAHLEMIQKYAKFYRDIGVTADDRILALSTCSYEYKNARTLVIAKLTG
jgi:sortase B